MRIRDGDYFVVNGQKTWSTGAYASDFALCPVRTRWDVPKHKGISVLIVDLKTPGIEVRRIRQMNGGAEFCEEFFTDVMVPAENLVGDENEGWRVARGLLEIEHAWVGRGGAADHRPEGRRAGSSPWSPTRGLGADEGIRRERGGDACRVDGTAAGFGAACPMLSPMASWSPATAVSSSWGMTSLRRESRSWPCG